MFTSKCILSFVLILIIVCMCGCNKSRNEKLTASDLEQISDVIKKTIDLYKEMDLKNIEKLHWKNSYSKKTFNKYANIASSNGKKSLKYFSDIHQDIYNGNRYIYYVLNNSATYIELLNTMYLDETSENYELPENITMVICPIIVNKKKSYLLYVKDKNSWYLTLHPNQMVDYDVDIADLKKILLPK